jgi:hypothetical protein
VLIAAGFIFVVENDTVNPTGEVKDFLGALYFIVVVSTCKGAAFTTGAVSGQEKSFGNRVSLF